MRHRHSLHNFEFSFSLMILSKVSNAPVSTGSWRCQCLPGPCPTAATEREGGPLCAHTPQSRDRPTKCEYILCTVVTISISLRVFLVYCWVSVPFSRSFPLSLPLCENLSFCLSRLCLFNSFFICFSLWVFYLFDCRESANTKAK